MKRILAISIICLLLFSECAKEETTRIIINFTQTVNGQKLMMGAGCTDGGECFPDHSCCTDTICPGKPYINESGERYNVKTLKYFISNITLHSSDSGLLGTGNSILLKDIHFIDAEDPSTLDFISQELNNGSYSAISYRMGITNSMNVDNIYLNEDFHDDMVWPITMGGGYHYMKLEGSFDNNTIVDNYNTHTGPTMGMDHSFPNQSSISINVTDNIGNISIDINMEINNWYQDPHTITITENGIMGNMVTQMNLMINGMQNVFSVNQ